MTLFLLFVRFLKIMKVFSIQIKIKYTFYSQNYFIDFAQIILLEIKTNTASVTMQWVIFTIAVLSLTANSMYCSEGEEGQCTACPESYHLFRHHCLYNIPHCLNYKESGFDCETCSKEYEQAFDQECTIVCSP